MYTSVCARDTRTIDCVFGLSFQPGEITRTRHRQRCRERYAFHLWITRHSRRRCHHLLGSCAQIRHVFAASSGALLENILLRSDVYQKTKHKRRKTKHKRGFMCLMERGFVKFVVSTSPFRPPGLAVISSGVYRAAVGVRCRMRYVRCVCVCLCLRLCVFVCECTCVAAAKKHGLRVATLRTTVVLKLKTDLFSLIVISFTAVVV